MVQVWRRRGRDTCSGCVRAAWRPWCDYVRSAVAGLNSGTEARCMAEHSGEQSITPCRVIHAGVSECPTIDYITHNAFIHAGTTCVRTSGFVNICNISHTMKNTHCRARISAVSSKATKLWLPCSVQVFKKLQMFNYPLLPLVCIT